MGELDFDEEDVKRVEVVWATVFRSSNKVLHDAKIYGFDGMGELPAPNIHDMVLVLKLISAMIDVLLNNDFPYEQTRQLLNAKLQITNMERLATALNAKSRVDFDAALAALDGQAVL